MRGVGLGIRVTMTAALLVGATASPALAHGDEHDVRRIAAGTIAGAEVTVWTADAPIDAGLPLTVGMDGASGARVQIVAEQAGGSSSTVEADDVGGGHWTAVVPVADSGPTALEVVVTLGSAAERLQFDYRPPTASWWMKTIVVLALLQGVASAGWLWERRHRVFDRSRLNDTSDNQALVGSAR